MEGNSGKKTELPYLVSGMDIEEHGEQVFDMSQQNEKNPLGLSEFQLLFRDNDTTKIVATLKKEKKIIVLGYAVCKAEGAAISIKRLVVDPPFWRNGIGTTMLTYIVSSLGSRKYLKCVVEESNKRARLFLQKVLSEFHERKNVFEQLWKDYYTVYDEDGTKKHRNGIYFCYRRLDTMKYKISNS